MVKYILIGLLILVGIVLIRNWQAYQLGVPQNSEAYPGPAASPANY